MKGLDAGGDVHDLQSLLPSRQLCAARQPCLRSSFKRLSLASVPLSSWTKVEAITCLSTCELRNFLVALPMRLRQSHRHTLHLSLVKCVAWSPTCFPRLSFGSHAFKLCHCMTSLPRHTTTTPIRAKRAKPPGTLQRREQLVQPLKKDCKMTQA